MTTTLKAKHTELIKNLASDKYTDGTYNLATMAKVEMDSGYQVTFCQLGDNYTEDDYEFLCAMFIEMSDDGIAYAGKFCGYPEVSFHFARKADAIKYAKMFNQISIWDWSVGEAIETGGTGRREA